MVLVGSSTISFVVFDIREKTGGVKLKQNFS